MIVVAGSANLDFVTRVSALPVPGETVLGPVYRTAPGGKGANQAVACARAGGEVTFVGALGPDTFAAPLQGSLRENGVHDATVSVDAPTGAAFITVSASGENCIVVAAGANAKLALCHLPPLSGVSHLVMQLETPLETVTAFAQAAREAGVTVVLNAAPARPLPDELWQLLDLLIVNGLELDLLAGAGEREEQLRSLQQRGPGRVVVTLGPQGCLTVDGPHLHAVSGHPVEALDTTGAGDTFVGVLVAELAAGQPFPQALDRAVVGSALACTREGAQPSMPHRAEIDAAQGKRGEVAQSRP